MASSSPPAVIIEADGDHFNGVIIRPMHYGQISASNFRHRLTDSLAMWKAKGKRGIWLTIPLAQSELIAVAADLGFVFHHTKPSKVTMTRWLPEYEKNILPIYATHNIGVAGFVVNDKNEVLLVQEKWQRDNKMNHWKLPGGVCDPGEDLWQTAIRETFEETGIKTTFVAMFSFRHMHAYKWGIDDIYFACLLRPLNKDLNPDRTEISAAKWMNVDEYIADPNTVPTNCCIAESYKQGSPPVSHYSVTPCNPTELCDLTMRDWSDEGKACVDKLAEKLTATAKI